MKLLLLRWRCSSCFKEGKAGTSSSNPGAGVSGLCICLEREAEEMKVSTMLSLSSKGSQSHGVHLKRHTG